MSEDRKNVPTLQGELIIPTPNSSFASSSSSSSPTTPRSKSAELEPRCEILGSALAGLSSELEAVAWSGYNFLVVLSGEIIPLGVCWCPSGLFDPILRSYGVILTSSVAEKFVGKARRRSKSLLPHRAFPRTCTCWCYINKYFPTFRYSRMQILAAPLEGWGWGHIQSPTDFCDGSGRWGSSTRGYTTE
jgi:hypothetical protein